MTPDQAASFAASTFSIVKDVTVTGLLFWLIFLLMTGRLVRREELDAAKAQTTESKADTVWWRDRFLGIADTAREGIATVRTVAESTRDVVLELRATLQADRNRSNRPGE